MVCSVHQHPSSHGPIDEIDKVGLNHQEAIVEHLMDQPEAEDGKRSGKGGLGDKQTGASGANSEPHHSKPNVGSSLYAPRPDVEAGTNTGAGAGTTREPLLPRRHRDTDHLDTNPAVLYALQCIRRTLNIFACCDSYVLVASVGQAIQMWLQQPNLPIMIGWLTICLLYCVNITFDIRLACTLPRITSRMGRSVLQTLVWWCNCAHIGSIALYAAFRFLLIAVGGDEKAISIILLVSLVRACKLRPLFKLQDAVHDESDELLKLRQHWPLQTGTNWKGYILILSLVVVAVVAARRMQHHAATHAMTFAVSGAQHLINPAPVRLSGCVGKVLSGTASGCGIGAWFDLIGAPLGCVAGAIAASTDC